MFPYNGHMGAMSSPRHPTSSYHQSERWRRWHWDHQWPVSQGRIVPRSLTLPSNAKRFAGWTLWLVGGWALPLWKILIIEVGWLFSMEKQQCSKPPTSVVVVPQFIQVHGPCLMAVKALVMATGSPILKARHISHLISITWNISTTLEVLLDLLQCYPFCT